MSRLPQPGGDSGDWGTILNDFLAVSHTGAGLLKDDIVTNDQLSPGSVTSASLAPDAVGANALADGSVTAPTLATTTAPGADDILSYNGTSLTWVVPAVGSVTPDATTSVKGVVMLGGDLNGTSTSAAAPIISDGAITNAKVSASAGIVGSKLAAAVQTSLGKADTAVQPAGIAGKADDTAVVHKAGTETVTGLKDFTGGITASGVALVTTADARLSDQRVPTDNSVSNAKLQTNAVTDVKITDGTISAAKLATAVQTSLGKADTAVQPAGIAGKADDTAVVHKAGTETVTGAKDFTGGITANSIALVITSDARLSDQRTPSDLSVTTTKLADGAVTDVKVNASAAIAQSKISGLTTSLSGKLAVASNLSDLASATTARTNLGLGNVDNTSDSTKNSASATLTNKIISGSSNTLSNISESAVTNLVSDLAGKAASSHTHAIADVTNLSTTFIARVVYASSWPARPSVSYVEWVGPVDPGVLAQNGDTWVDTSV